MLTKNHINRILYTSLAQIGPTSLSHEAEQQNTLQNFTETSTQHMVTIFLFFPDSSDVLSWSDSL